MPREIVNHDLKDSEKVGANGKPLVCIGYEVSEQLEYRRGGLFVLEHRRFKYAPADYQQSDTGAAIVVADKPPQPIEKGLAGPGLLAYVITSKLADHLPLYRLERIFARDGVHIADSTMCGWILAVAELVTPLVLLMKQRVKQSKAIHTDETRVPVQAKGKCRSGRVWDYIGDASHPYIVFEYTPDRTNTWRNCLPRGALFLIKGDRMRAAWMLRPGTRRLNRPPAPAVRSEIARFRHSPPGSTNSNLRSPT